MSSLAMEYLIRSILVRELEVLIEQKLPKWPLLERWLLELGVKADRVKKLSQDLRTTLLAIWKQNDKLLPGLDSTFFSNPSIVALEIIYSSVSNTLIFNALKNVIGDSLSKENITTGMTIIITEFKTWSVSSLLRIIKQLNVISKTTECRSDDLLIVSTMDGKITAVDIFSGIVIWSIKVGPPLYLPSTSKFVITHEKKNMEIIPSLKGSLFKNGHGNVPEALPFSLDYLFLSSTYTTDMVFTGDRTEYIDCFSKIKKFNKNKKSLTNASTQKDILENMNLILKRTRRSLVAKDRCTLQDKWKFIVSEIDIIQKNCDGQNSHGSSDTSKNFRVDFPKGMIYRLVDHSISRNNFFWKLCLRFSIANVWLLQNKKLERLNLFSYPNIDFSDKLPKYFVGKYKKKMYIQESLEIQNMQNNNTNREWWNIIFDDQFSTTNETKQSKLTQKNGFYFFQDKLSSEETISNINEDAMISYNSHFNGNFHLVKRLGGGGFGKVVEATHKYDNKNYAIKRIKIDNIKEKDQFKREVEVQAQLDHLNVVRYYNSWMEEPPEDWDDPLVTESDDEESSISDYCTSYNVNSNAFFYIQMELCKEGDLSTWLMNNNTFEKRNKQYGDIFKQIVTGVEYIHEQGLIHRDLKPKNIFFYSENHIKIGDFGLVTNINNPLPYIEGSLFKNCDMLKNIEHTPNVGTSLYCAPEQKKGKSYNYKVDIWSLAIILVELISVFKTYCERIKDLEALHNGRLPQQVIDNYPKVCKLLQLMLMHDPKKRPCTYGVRAHPPINEDVNKDFHFEMPRK